MSDRAHWLEGVPMSVLQRIAGDAGLNGSGHSQNGNSRNGAARTKSNGSGNGFVFGQWSDFVQKLVETRLPASERAKRPFDNHPWVFAAAMAIAVTLGQAPFRIFRETDEQVERRRRIAAKRGDTAWRVSTRRGFKRRAAQRWYAKTALSRITARALEPDDDHPVLDALARPNPLQRSSAQLFMMTHLWMAVRGEAFWVLTVDGEARRMPGDQPTEIWPLGPDLFEPIYAEGESGELVGWWLKVPRYMPRRTGIIPHTRVPLMLSEIVQFKLPNPANPVRGMSRLTAVAQGIEADMLIQTQNRTLLENDSTPKGVLTYPNGMTKTEKASFIQEWEELHGGVDNKGRTGLLTDGMTYQTVSLTPEEMQFLERLKWDRDEILAVMQVPPAVLGLTEELNYATHLGQKQMFWENALLPLARIEETAIDGAFLFEEPDDVVGMFDLSEIDALRAGVADKATTADKLAGANIHMPPRDAFTLVGLDNVEYPGADKALVSPMLTTVEDLLVAPEIDPNADPEEPDDEEDPEDPPDPEEDPEGDERDARALCRARFPHPDFVGLGHPAVHTDKRIRKASSAKRWREFVAFEEANEGVFKNAYRRWVATEKQKTLDAFDKVARRVGATRASVLQALARLKDGAGDFVAAIPELGSMRSRLGGEVRPKLDKMLIDTFEFSMPDFGGVPVFELDAPAVLAAIDVRQGHIVRTIPAALQKNITKQIVEGFNAGETIAQIRARVAQVFNISASSSRALRVARTETSAFINEARDRMFGAQGFEKEAWATAGDEVVRAPHVEFGDAGPQDRGFNYLTLVGSNAGVLTHPQDSRCTDPSMVVNCRCIKVPA